MDTGKRLKRTDASSAARGVKNGAAAAPLSAPEAAGCAAPERIPVLDEIPGREEAEERYRATFEFAPVGIMHTGMDRRILHVNSKLCEILGYTREELLRMTTRDIVRVGDAELDQPSYLQPMLEGRMRVFASERPYARKDGSTVWVNRTVSLVKDAAGKPLYFIRIIEDISERKRAEAQLARLTRARRVMAECNQALVHATTERDLMRKMCEILVDSGGYRQAWIGLPVDDESKSIAIGGSAGYEAGYLEALERSWAADGKYYGVMGHVIATGEPLVSQNILADTRFSGRRARALDRKYQSSASLPLKDAGRVIGGISIYAVEPDAFDREELELLQELAADIAFGIANIRTRIACGQAEEAVARERALLRAVVDTLPDHIYVKDRTGRYLLINQEGLKLRGMTHDEVVGKTVYEVLPRKLAEKFDAEDRAVMESAAPIANREESVVFDTSERARGGVRWHMTSKVPLRDAAGNVIGIVGVNRDITSRKRAEEALRESEERYRNLFELAPLPVCVIDEKSLVILAANQAATEKYGYTHEKFLSMSILDLQVEEDRVRVAQELEQRDPRKANFSLRRHVTRSGEVIFAEVTARPFMFHGRRCRILLINDVTERRRAEAALQESEELFRQLAGNIPQAFWISDVDQRQTLYVSPAAGTLLGRPLEEIKSDRRALIRAVHEEDRARLHAARKAVAHGGYDETYRIVRPDGSLRWVRDRGFPVRDAAGNIYRIAGIAEDITAIREAEERLMYLAHYDGLTNLPNRVLFYDRLKQALAQARRSRWVTAVLFIDLDRFKNVNDTLGHGAGDELLKQVSARLTDCVRAGDTVGRLGGDEFAIVLSNLAGAGDASLVAQKIMAALGAPFTLDNQEVYATVSIGITLYPNDSSDQDTLIRNADTAMYRAKELGGNGYQFYTPEMNARALERLSLEASLRRALEGKEFLLYYQPKASLASGEVTGVEALLRWRHPERGLVSPAEFIPMLEETGLIVPVGEWVIQAACAQIKAWQQAGVNPVPIAINLSARQFQAENLGESIRRIIEQQGVDSKLLEIEITESSLMNNTEEAIDTLTFLSALGLRVAIDDFGTGYSSLSYLKRFPVDTLKIDGSFVRDVIADADDAAITRAIISMAHSLDLTVIAEGVETEQQLNFLTANGCDEIQGYCFARPLPAEECTQLLREGRQLELPAIRSGSEAATVLLVDDDQDLVLLLKRQLERDGYAVLTARDAQEGFQVLSKNRIDLVISDQQMPGMSGVEFLQRVKLLYPMTVRLMLSGHDDFQTVADAINKSEIVRFLPKDLEPQQIRAYIRQAMLQRRPFAGQRHPGAAG